MLRFPLRRLKMQFRHLAPIAVLLLIASCVTIIESPEELLEDVRTGSVCCQSFSQMRYQALVANKPVTLTLTKGTPIFVFGNERSYFGAYSLDQNRGRVMEFRTYFYRRHVFMPMFTFLNASHEVVAVLRPERVRSGAGDVQEPPVGHSFFTGEVRIPQQAAFMVVHTSSAAPHPPTIFDYSSPRVVNLPRAVGGELRLTLLDAEPMAVIADSLEPQREAEADLFILAEVSGKRIPTSRPRRWAGRIVANIVSRRVPAKLTTFRLEGRRVYLGLLNMASKPSLDFTAEISFAPEEDKTYVVKGDLGGGDAVLWVEDFHTKTVIREVRATRASR